jgi:hypothetical protein
MYKNNLFSIIFLVLDWLLPISYPHNNMVTFEHFFPKNPWYE